MRLFLTLMILAAVIVVGGGAIADLGELVHFSCRAQTCELTHEPLIGKLQISQIAKSDLLKTTVQSKGNFFGRLFRLALVTQSGEFPLARNWSRSANNQLLSQRNQIDQFLKDDQVETLYVRTHRPGQLWVILGGLGIAAGIVLTRLWLPKSS